MRILSVMSMVVGLLIAGPALAQTEISVVASGSVTVPHDSFSTWVTAPSSKHKSRPEALKQGAQLALSLKADLEKVGLVNNVDFKIENVYVSMDWNDQLRKHDGFRPYVRARVSFLFSHDNSEAISNLLMTKYQSGQLDSMVSDEALRDARSAARVEAAAVATEMARAHAQGAQCQLGGILRIVEGDRGYSPGIGTRSAAASSVVSDTAAVGRASSVTATGTYVFSCGKAS